MKCEKCGKFNATTHICTNVNGIVLEKNLCSFCAEELNAVSQNPLELMLSSILRDASPLGDKKCPICSTDFNSIAKSGKMGCAQCYITFKSEILPYIKRLHGNTRHIGSNPNIYPEKDSIVLLREKLKRLIADENYEQAAVIRDKIREMEANRNE